MGVVGLLVLAVVAFAVFEPVQVLPRIRIAPGFSMVDQTGGVLTSDDGWGAVTLYTFAPAGCGEECDVIHQTMAEVGDRVGDEIDLGTVDFRMVTVALDTDDPGSLSGAAVRTGADGVVWRWAGAAPEVRKTVVGGGFGVFFDDSGGDVVFDRTYVIVDGSGLIRGEYTYATLVSDADRLTRHIGLLADEIRNADGNTALLYEAAHVFLCYP